MVEIIEYDEQYAEDFKKINLEWLDKLNLTEEADLIMLNNPREAIIQPGGAVFLAKAGHEIIGSAAIISAHDNIYELAKMTVVPTWQGRGISKLLLERCLAVARRNSAKKIVLFSHHKLDAALQLYAKYGFVQVEVTDSPFATADIKMELNLPTETTR
ncbi:MAG TPA: GNAT family N-acetyltransferase [Chryseolinea sp.]